MTAAEFKDLIDRYIAGNVSDNEKRLVDDWYASYTKQSGENTPANDEQLKADMHTGIKEKLNKPGAKVRRIRVMRYAAAVALVLVSASLLLRKKNSTQAVSVENTESFTSIRTKQGEVKKIDLPDGSQIWLNAKSVLRICDNFQNKQQRYVFLDEGEAFFEVTKNPQRPFFVKTPHITTKVLGTSFNVRSYQALGNSSVTVRTGRVQVNNLQKQLAILTPNMQVNYNPANEKANVIKTDGSIANTWTKGKVMLNKATFKELAFALNNIYGVKLSSRNRATTSYLYNININTSHTLDETLRIICSVHQNHYRRNADEVVIY
ncbi:MAG: FecR family protein [Mucilaginibacter sp.]|nr:FecR family protein [Mucilaginibacter sp.]